MTQEAKNKKLDLLVVVCFTFLISLPLILSLTISPHEKWLVNGSYRSRPSWEPDADYSRLSPAKKAVATYKSTKRFMVNFEEYYSSTFPLRSNLLNAFTNFHVKVLNANPLPNKVVAGTDGWYFLGSNNVLGSKGIVNFTPKELSDLIRNVHSREDWLQQKGIAYYVAVAPNPLTIYGDFLPIVKSKKRTCLDQMDSAAVGQFNLVDLRKGFTGAGPRTYHKTDSHWNEVGAFCGYETLIRRISFDFPGTKILHSNDFHLDSLIAQQMDLTRMLGLKVDETVYLLKENGKSDVTHQPSKLDVPKNAFDPRSYERRFHSGANALKAIIFRDSYASSIEKYIAASFGETVFIWSHEFNKELIEKENPDLVIHLIVERNVQRLNNKMQGE